MLSGTGRGNAILWMLLALGMGGGYWAWRMIPAYHDAWAIDEILRDASTAALKASRLDVQRRERALRELVVQTRSRVSRELRSEDPAVEVRLDIDEKELRMSAQYHVLIDHPGLHRTSSVSFRRSASTRL